MKSVVYTINSTWQFTQVSTSRAREACVTYAAVFSFELQHSCPNLLLMNTKLKK